MTTASPRTSREPPLPPASSAQQEEDELERFRAEWRREVQDRRAGGGAAAAPAAPVLAASAGNGHIPAQQVISLRLDEASRQIRSPETSPVRNKEEHRRRPAHPAALEEDAPPPHAIAPQMIAQRQVKQFKGDARAQTNKAVDLYGQAVDNELSGQLREALHLYRKAFRLDGNVERAYAKKIVQDEHALVEATPELEVIDPSLPVSAHAPSNKPYVFKKEVQYHPDYAPAYHRMAPRPASPSPEATTPQNTTDADGADLEVVTPSDPLSKIIASFPPGHLAFEPEEEKWPVRLERLPEEVFQHVLRFLDVQAVERVALVSRKARVWTRSARNWRRLCESIYRPSQVPPDLTPLVLAHRHGLDWRTTLIEEPRVRYDGVYIAVCHYVRQGASDEAWVTISHLITYHRFLRFYPDGTVISYLTTEQPAEVVHSLRPSLRGTGLNFGTWSLLRPTASHPHPRVQIRQLLEPGVTPKYEFEMDITLKTTHRGRWNKLDLNVYRSINLATEESLDMPLKHQKPFYFSKVRSYHPTF